MLSVILALRRALPDLVTGMLALGRRHLPPALHVPLEAFPLLGAHGLIALEAFSDLLLLLRRQALEAVVRRVQLALALPRQRLVALEVLQHAGAIGGRHAAEALVVLPRLL